MTVESSSPGHGGKIVTFYSYKGGTGRSMALANVAWVLASSGRRVLTVDWDLEAPGLHRYFEPFLADKNLERSTGIIDFVNEFATAAVSSNLDVGPDWYEEYSNLLAHAVPLDWKFASGGLLHFVPAGRQDATYPLRVNSFDWQNFYERLGGGVLLEKVKKNLREVYDVILIDSRTGVSDTAGVCTIQMPDEMVVCFTLNRQSIYGASAAARSAFKKRRTPTGEPTLKIWPVPTRVETFEKDRLELASTVARARFAGLMRHMGPQEEDDYWGLISVGYEPYYAYEEVLASFRDRPRHPGSMLYSMSTLANYLSGGELGKTEAIEELQRSEILSAFTTRSAREYEHEFELLGDEYEDIRERMKPGGERTSLMNVLVSRIQTLGGQRDAGAMAEKLFSRGSDGGRIVGLALARRDPQRQHIELALSGFAESRSAFEQFHALLLVRALMNVLYSNAAAQLRSAIASQIGTTIFEGDPSRWTEAHELVGELGSIADLERPFEAQEVAYSICGVTQVIVGAKPPSARVRYNDNAENHGEWVTSRASHSLRISPTIGLGKYLVTNFLFQKFVREGGYQNEAHWDVRKQARDRFVTLDKQSPGPGNWPNSNTLPTGKEHHPVTSISYAEAKAFVNWCNTLGENSGASWSIPGEDDWEFMARTEAGFIYPWGDAFDLGRCNSLESGIGDTSEVTRFELEASKTGCCDMAGNVWEFVRAVDTTRSTCVLRGGSFKNDRFVVRSYLRLFGVPVTHRPPDFGIRLAKTG